jgi:hypothetical protein
MSISCSSYALLLDMRSDVLSTYCTGYARLNELFASKEKKMEVWDRAKEMVILLPKELRPKNYARATRKERMYVGYYFKDGLGQNRRPVLPGEEPTQEDFVQIRNINNPPEKQVVIHGKPY